MLFKGGYQKVIFFINQVYFSEDTPLKCSLQLKDNDAVQRCAPLCTFPVGSNTHRLQSPLYQSTGIHHSDTQRQRKAVS